MLGKEGPSQHTMSPLWVVTLHTDHMESTMELRRKKRQKAFVQVRDLGAVEEP